MISCSGATGDAISCAAAARSISSMNECVVFCMLRIASPSCRAIFGSCSGPKSNSATMSISSVSEGLNMAIRQTLSGLAAASWHARHPAPPLFHFS